MSEKRITCELKEHIGIISSYHGWRKELNIISWNGGTPKFDIRAWSDDHRKKGRGVTLTDYELGSLVKIYTEMKNNLIWDEAARKEEEIRSGSQDVFNWEHDNPEIEKANQEAAEGALPPGEELPEGEPDLAQDNDEDYPLIPADNQEESGDAAGFDRGEENAGFSS